MQNAAAFYGCIAEANPAIDPAQLDRALAMVNWEDLARDDRATEDDNVERSKDGIQKCILHEQVVTSSEAERDEVIAAVQATAEWFGLEARFESGFNLYLTILRYDGKMVEDVVEGAEGERGYAVEYLDDNKPPCPYDLWWRAQAEIRKAVRP